MAIDSDKFSTSDFYYAFLGKAYKLADLSIVYPLARGSAVFYSFM